MEPAVAYHGNRFIAHYSKNRSLSTLSHCIELHKNEQALIKRNAV